MTEQEKNFFTSELHQYYLAQGKNLSEQVINILNKSASDLSEEERKTYERIILPTRENIKWALAERMQMYDASEDEWREQFLFLSDTVIGQMAAEILSEPQMKLEVPQKQDISQTGIEMSSQSETINTGTPQVLDVDKKKIKTKALAIGLATLSIVVIVVIALLLTVFRGDKTFSHGGLEVEIPKGCEVEVSQRESCGLTVNSIRIYPNGADEFWGVLIEYPSPDPVCYSTEYIGKNYSYERTRIGGQDAIIRGNDFWSSSSIYLIDGQISILAGDIEYEDMMFGVAESIKWDYEIYEVPPLLSGGYSEIVGTWKSSDDSNFTLRIAYSSEAGMVFGRVDGEQKEFMAEPDGRVLDNQDLVDKYIEQLAYGGDYMLLANLMILGDGTELSATIFGVPIPNCSEDTAYSGDYVKVSKDPFYGMESPSGHQFSRDEYITLMDTLIQTLMEIDVLIKDTATEINNNIDANNNRMKKDLSTDCYNLSESLEMMKELVDSVTIPSGFIKVNSQFLQLVDYCLQRVDALIAGINAVESGGNYVSAFEQGVAPKKSYEELLPVFQSQYNSLK